MEDSLVSRRSKRSTAGNRMEAALAEFKAEDIGVDVEDDKDFFVEKDEEDAFGSDFESTDEEADQENAEESSEKVIQDEERRVKKTARSQLERITAAAHARQAATFNPQVEITPKPKTAKPKRRVSMGVVMDAETGEILEGSSAGDHTPSLLAGKRQSKRTHTMLSTSAHVNRMRDAEKKQASVPKKPKVKSKAPTQDELIARALDMEEGNIKEHKNYLTLEEEKRKRARLIRTAVEGPLIRWVSRTEKVKVIEEPPPLPPSSQLPPPPPVQYGYSYPGAPQPSMSNGSGSVYQPSPVPYPYYMTPDPYHSHQQTQFPSTAHPSQNVQALHPSSSILPSPYIYQPFPPDLAASVPVLPSSSSSDSVIPPSLPPPSIPQAPIVRTETVARNYVVHELEQEDGAPRPLWKDTMAAMFGDHVKWEDLRVYVTKNRPWTRPVLVCPITGQPAKYLDPRTAVPFANVHGYRTLSQILAHEFVWDATAGCYTGYAGRPAPANETEEQEEDPDTEMQSEQHGSGPPPPTESEPATTTRRRGRSAVTVLS